MLTDIELVLTDVTQWAEQRSDIRGVLLVGSYARGTARPDSDVDLVIITKEPSTYRNTNTWSESFNWSGWRAAVVSSHDADYGPVWSRHFVLADGSDIEFGFAAPSWVQTDPLDVGTRGVVKDGARIIFDPDSLLQVLVDACQPV